MNWCVMAWGTLASSFSTPLGSSLRVPYFRYPKRNDDASNSKTCIAVFSSLTDEAVLVSIICTDQFMIYSSQIPHHMCGHLDIVNVRSTKQTLFFAFSILFFYYLMTCPLDRSAAKSTSQVNLPILSIMQYLGQFAFVYILREDWPQRCSSIKERR